MIRNINLNKFILVVLISIFFDLHKKSFLNYTAPRKKGLEPCSANLTTLPQYNKFMNLKKYKIDFLQSFIKFFYSIYKEKRKSVTTKLEKYFCSFSITSLKRLVYYFLSLVLMTLFLIEKPFYHLPK